MNVNSITGTASTTLFYRAQMGAFGYTPRFDRLFETEGERADCIAGLGLTVEERANLDSVGYTDLLGERLDGHEFVRYSVVDDTDPAYMLECDHEIAMEEIKQLVEALAILDRMIADQDKERVSKEEQEYSAVLADSETFVRLQYVDDVKLEIYLTPRGKYNLYMTGNHSTLYGTYKSERVAMYAIQQIAGF